MPTGTVEERIAEMIVEKPIDLREIGLAVGVLDSE